MRRGLVLLALLAVIAAACSDTATTTAGATAPTAVGTSEPLLPTTTPTAAPTTTSVVSLLDRTASPTEELAAFNARVVVTFSGEDGIAALNAETSGTFVEGDIKCIVRIDLAGLSVEEAAIVTPEGAWVSTVQAPEFTEVPEDDADLVSTLDGCPVTDEFWEGLDIDPLRNLNRTAETVNGIPAQRIDVGDAIEALNDLGIIDDVPAGVSIEVFSIWIADDGGYPAAADISFTMDQDVAEAEFGLSLEGVVTFRFHAEVTNPNDPGLTVTPP